jgi:hypothetical protein
MQMYTYLAHIVVNPNDLSVVNPVKMGKRCSVPESVCFPPELVLARDNSANWGANDLINYFMPNRIGTVDLPKVLVIEILTFVDTIVGMAIGQFPKALGVNKRIIRLHKPIVQHTDVEVLNDSGQGRAKEPPQEVSEYGHDDLF